MNKTRTIAALLLAAVIFPVGRLSAQDPAGAVSYALPQTTISLEVDAVIEYFHAGPYARYAQKYLGVEAGQEDRSTCTLSAVRMTPCIEADQNHRHFLVPGKNGIPSFVTLTSQGLIAVNDGNFGKS